MFKRHKTVDFRTIDIRTPDNVKGKVTKRAYSFSISTLYIEHVREQYKRLAALKQELLIGDSIEIDTYFGWHDGNEWLTFPIKGRFRVKGIFSEDNEIRLTFNPINIKFRR